MRPSRLIIIGLVITVAVILIAAWPNRHTPDKQVSPSNQYPVQAWGTNACSTGTQAVLADWFKGKVALSGSFRGTSIENLAQNLINQTGVKADPLTAVTSTDGSQLVVGFLSCDGVSKIQATSTPTINVVLFSDTTSTYLGSWPEFYGANFGAMYVPIGFVSDTHTVLLEGLMTGLGAGGSCAPISWISLNTDTVASSTFDTQPQSLSYDRWSKVVYPDPASCIGDTEEIFVVDTLTGKKRSLKKLPGTSFAELLNIEKTVKGYRLHYRAGDKQATLDLP